MLDSAFLVENKKDWIILKTSLFITFSCFQPTLYFIYITYECGRVLFLYKYFLKKCNPKVLLCRQHFAVVTHKFVEAKREPHEDTSKHFHFEPLVVGASGQGIKLPPKVKKKKLNIFIFIFVG